MVNHLSLSSIASFWCFTSSSFIHFIVWNVVDLLRLHFFREARTLETKIHQTVHEQTRQIRRPFPLRYRINSHSNTQTFTVMSSGLGLKGNVSRCFYYFEDFASCMVRSDHHPSYHIPKTMTISQRWYTPHTSDALPSTLFLILIITWTPIVVVVQKKSEDPLNQCLALRNDYLECLHHKKEVSIGQWDGTY